LFDESSSDLPVKEKLVLLVQSLSNLTTSDVVFYEGGRLPLLLYEVNTELLLVI
jgi:hypothetical protein